VADVMAETMQRVIQGEDPTSATKRGDRQIKRLLSR